MKLSHNVGARPWLALLSLFMLNAAGCANHPAVQVEERSVGPAAVSAAPVTAVTVAPGAVTSSAAAPMSAEVAAGVNNGTLHVVKKGEGLYAIGREHNANPKDLAAWNNLQDPNKLEEGQVIRLTPPADGVVVKPVAPAPVVESRPMPGPAPAVVPVSGAKLAADNLKREPKAGKEPYSDEAWAKLSKPAAAKPMVTANEKPVVTANEKPVTAANEKPVPGGDTVDWGWPASGKVVKPYSASGNKGVDIEGKVGDPVLAAAAGKVIYAGNYPKYGKLLIVKHNGTLLSAYAHNNQLLVKEGQSVAKGQKIAELGKSDSDMPMLHFEIRSKGTSIDPGKYLPAKE